MATTDITNMSSADLDALLGMAPDENPHIGEAARARWEKKTPAQRRRDTERTAGQVTPRSRAWDHEDTEAL
jgi:hypothetical protein